MFFTFFSMGFLLFSFPSFVLEAGLSLPPARNQTKDMVILKIVVILHTSSILFKKSKKQTEAK